MNNKAKLEENFNKVKDAKRPKVPVFKNSLIAFVVGGGICVLAQLFNDFLASLGLSKNEAATLTTLALVFIASLLTGIGVYDKIGRVCGAGSIVPITGFANSIVSCAMDFKAEGPVFGLGAKMFNVAGPVLVYGFTSSWVVGLIYYIYLMIAG